jgi:hypothetical protein
MYNQPFPPPQPPSFPPPPSAFPPPPSQPPGGDGGGSSTKYILGAIGAVGCLGLILSALAVGGYFYLNKSRNTNNDNIAIANGNNSNSSNSNNRNTNSSNTNNSNTNGNSGSSSGGGLMRSRIQQQVGSFRLQSVNPVGEAPTYTYPFMNSASQILTDIIRNSGANETWLARYTDSRTTIDFHRVDHRIAVLSSPAEANTLLQQAVTQLQGAGYRVARRDQTRLTDNSIAGSKIFMETGQTDTSDEVVLWTNRNLFCSAATGRRGNATRFESGTTY